MIKQIHRMETYGSYKFRPQQRYFPGRLPEVAIKTGPFLSGSRGVYNEPRLQGSPCRDALGAAVDNPESERPSSNAPNDDQPQARRANCGAAAGTTPWTAGQSIRRPIWPQFGISAWRHIAIWRQNEGRSLEVRFWYLFDEHKNAFCRTRGCKSVAAI